MKTITLGSKNSLTKREYYIVTQTQPIIPFLNQLKKYYEKNRTI
jgi:hypothetical protein